ncbi:MAG: PQQ-binding-like beta-propeller repeat protein [Planctomycetota bacterium]
MATGSVPSISTILLILIPLNLVILADGVDAEPTAAKTPADSLPGEQGVADEAKVASVGGWPGWLGKHRDAHCDWLPKSLPSKANTVWRQGLAGPGLGGVAATTKYVVIGDRDLQDTADVYRCYSASDGEPIWSIARPTIGSFDYGNSPRTTPLINGNLVYVVGASGDLICLELATGVEVWSKNFQIDFGVLDERPWGACGSPLLREGKLLVNPGGPDASIVALSPDSGEELWRAPGGPASYGSLTSGKLGGVKQVVGHDKISLGGWHLRSGERLWTITPDVADDFNVPMPVVVGDRLLVSSENNGTRLYEFGKEGKINPTPVAANSDLAPDIGTPVVVGNQVFAVWNQAFCLDVTDGLVVKWTASDDAYASYASILAHDDRLLVVSGSGELILLDIGGPAYRVESRLRILEDRDSELYSHPAIVGTRLYLRGEDELVCVDLEDTPANHVP